VADRNAVSGVNRLAALILSLVWLCAGVAGLVLGIARSRIVPIIASLLAIGYAILWFRVFARSRLLTWHELIAPWRTR